MDRQKLLFPALLAFVLAGCGGSGSHNGSNDGGGGTTATDITKATTDLNTLLAKANTGGSYSSTELNTVSAEFDSAYTKTGDPRAALGYAVVRAAYAAQVTSDAFGSSAARSKSAAASGLADALARLAPLKGLKTTLGGSNRISLGTLFPTLANGTKSKAYPQDPTPAQVRAALAVLDSELTKVTNHLPDSAVNALETNPLVLANPSDTGTTVKLGSVEAYALRSVVRALHGIVDAALAYDFDAGTYDPSADFLTAHGGTLQVGQVFTTADYLPGGDFGKLADGGAAHLQDLGTQWNGVAEDGKAAIAKYRARTGTGYLTDLAGETASETDLANAESQLDTFELALNNSIPITVTVPDQNGNDQQVSLSIKPSALFGGNPPQDLRTFFPSLQVTEFDADAKTFTLVPVAGSISDPTFGGLVDLSGGVPAPVLYGRELHFDFEDGSAPTTAQVATEAFAFFTYR